MAKSLQERSSALFNHNLKTQSLQFEVKVDAGDETVIAEDSVASGELLVAANGTFRIEIDQEDLAADVDRVKSVELVSLSSGTATAAASIVAGKIRIDIDSSLDLSAVDLDAEIRVTYKLK
jgi:hypothetical protein